MTKELTEFEKYKALFCIHHPDEVLKSWINEETFTNLYKDNWDEIQECYSILEDLMTDNNVFEGIEENNMEEYDHMKENLALSFLEGNKANAFEWLFSLVEWYQEELTKIMEE